MQRTVPDRMMSRVFGILDSVAVLATVLGALFAPLVLDRLGLRGSLLLAGGILIAISLACAPKLFSIDRSTDARRRELAPRIKLLAGLAIFEGMPRQSLEALADTTSEENLAPDQVLIREGDDPDDFFVIRSGTLEVLSRGEAETEVKVRDLGPGDYAGEIGLIERIPRTATVRTTTDATVVRIGGREFLDAVTGSAGVSGALAAGIAGRLARTHPSYGTKVRDSTND